MSVQIEPPKPIEKNLNSDSHEQRGNEIELLQSMENLVEVWRVISRRALTCVSQ